MAKRLLEENESGSMHLCLLCRNTLSAEKARDILLTSCPGTNIDLITVDTSKPHSIISACEEIVSR